ncbi:hypothetical protein K493DRAFT_295031 [Basidiobolus meristosporus CBS 931.73]|uniref:Helicase C-terminal domain-containing protein n=1 Tax=Basidiobolus meristosporus CBS 931.73 TaxID=1314790 RepID=A0A1Y1ZDS5_9FUNG|nr:hypothetical protein K493DRAFT_295031 [Basidiobolus meristosporus CBS 931.73]|eukprot:ORY08442.1 hypothetical protein K493DRAFT_295031 [Basidiobolus meristosporus CBS 931.73]
MNTIDREEDDVEAVSAGILDEISTLLGSGDKEEEAVASTSNSNPSSLLPKMTSEQVEIDHAIDNNNATPNEDILKTNTQQRGNTTEGLDLEQVFMEDFISGVANNTVNKHSVKTQQVIDILQKEILANGEHNWVVIFSSFNLMLDLIAYYLKRNSIPFLTITGYTPVQVKKSNLKQFAPLVPENGIQMVSVAIFTDNWWNPFVEAQAKACVWRVNQPKDVVSYQRIKQDSIESQGLIDSQTQKLNLLTRMSNTIVDESSKVPISLNLQRKMTYDDDDDDDDDDLKRKEKESERRRLLNRIAVQ